MIRGRVVSQAYINVLSPKKVSLYDCQRQEELTVAKYELVEAEDERQVLMTGVML